MCRCGITTVAAWCVRRGRGVAYDEAQRPGDSADIVRLGTPGETEGHWISQFIWMPVPYGAHKISGSNTAWPFAVPTS